MESNKDKADICEVCNEPLKKGEPWLGCEKCGRMYGPCCNFRSGKPLRRLLNVRHERPARLL